MATSDVELSKHIAIARAVRDDMSASDFRVSLSDLFPPARKGRRPLPLQSATPATRMTRRRPVEKLH